MKCELCGWLDMHSPSCPLSEPQDLSSINQPTITALRQTVLELREQLRKREEEEAAACPEDVGFPEWCRALVKQRDRALSELADARKNKERLGRALEIEDDYFLDIALTLEDSDISQLCLIAAGIRETLKNRKIALSNIADREAANAARAATDTSLKD